MSGAAPGDPPQLTADRPSLHSAAFVLLLCGAYVAAAWWIDRGNGTFQRLGALAAPLAIATPFVLLTYLVRYWRWDWLLRRQGHQTPPLRGLGAYLAGFALTATPGKAGELLRLRYFARMGVPPQNSLATFVFERASDLLVILLLSLLAAPLFPTLGMMAAIVLTFVGLLFAVARWPAALRSLGLLGQRMPWAWMRRLVALALGAAHELRQCLTLPAMVRSVCSGGVAWGLTSAVFLWICWKLDINLPSGVAWGIYPLAMLVGALSFVPGGVGTTELAIVLMLRQLGVSPPEAWAAAIAVRLVTLWFAVGVGFLAMLAMELSRSGERSPSRGL